MSQTFTEWWDKEDKTHFDGIPIVIALTAWKARQAEIDELRNECARIQSSFSACEHIRLRQENERLREALEEITAAGEYGSNFPQDGRMYDIAHAALKTK
jgi:hypothetical protein